MTETPAPAPTSTPAAPSALPSGTFALGGDLPVTRLGFGAMRITGRGIWGPPADHDTAISVLRRAVELGVDFIDTADSYGPYVSEDLIREALHPYDGVVIATKAGFTRQGPDRWAVVGRPEYLRQCLEMSLRRLDVERIDLYQLHRIDPLVPLADQIGELKALQDEGKIRHLGLSEVTVDGARGGARDRPHRQRPEPVQPGEPAVRGPPRPRHDGGHRLHPLVPDRQPRAGPRRGAARCPGASHGSHTGSAGARLAAASVPGDASDPRDGLRRPSRGERRGGPGGAHRRGLRRALGPRRRVSPGVSSVVRRVAGIAPARRFGVVPTPG